MKRVPILFLQAVPVDPIVTELYRRTEEILVKSDQMEDVKRVALKFDQKVFNKKFFDALKDCNPDLYGGLELIGERHKLAISTASIHHYSRNDLLYLYNCEHAGVMVNNRLNAKALIQQIIQSQECLWKYYDKLWEDIHTGRDRLEQYNCLVQQINDLRYSFSGDFTSLCNCEFKTPLRP